MTTVDVFPISYHCSTCTGQHWSKLSCAGIIEEPNGCHCPVDDDSKDEDEDQADHDKDEATACSNPPEPHLRWEGWFSDASDGILLQVRSIGCKLRPGSLILLSEAHAVPLVS